jgi:hypothetical protein
MNGYSSHLRKAASEVRAIAKTDERSAMSPALLEELAQRLDYASAVSDAAVGAEIETLLYCLVDSFQLPGGIPPSLAAVCDAHQRAKKRRVKQ